MPSTQHASYLLLTSSLHQHPAPGPGTAGVQNTQRRSVDCSPEVPDPWARGGRQLRRIACWFGL